MERLRQRVVSAQTALARLLELAGIANPSELQRDAAIKRFDDTFETTWKAGQRYLRDLEGIDANSPKAVIRATMETGLLNEEDTRLALAMADDRNLTAHTYNEDLAQQIFAKLARYASLMQSWLSAISSRL